MNLRKLLCGLLALCLLLTMAPAALMEELEAPVAEVVEELGEVAEAEDVAVIGLDDPDPKEFEIQQNVDRTIRVGQVSTIPFAYPIVAAGADKLDVVDLHVVDDTKLEMTGVGAGDTIITVTLRTNSATEATITAFVNLTVKGNATPANINFFDDSLENITGKTINADLVGVRMHLNAMVFAGDRTQLVKAGSGAAGVVGYQKIIWSSSNSSVASISQVKNTDGTPYYRNDPFAEVVTVNFKKAGTAKITATVKGTAVKCSITFKISDAHKPTKVAIVPISDYIQTLTDKQNVFGLQKDDHVDLFAAIDPADYGYDVTWTVSDPTVAYFTSNNRKNGTHLSTKVFHNGNVDSALKLWIRKAGTVKITAKVYNGKSDSYTLKIINLNSFRGVTIQQADGRNIQNKKITRSLSYVDREYYDYDQGALVSAQGNWTWVHGIITNYFGDPVDPLKATITWKSSNTKVATITKDHFDATGSWARIDLKKKGTTTISMKAKSATGITKTASFTLTVNDPTEPVAIYFVDNDNIERTALTLKKGQKAGINVVAEYLTSSANPDAMMSYNQLKFSTSDKYVAKVSSTGVITAVKKGTAYIKVKTYNGLTKKLKVVVK